MTSSIPQSKVTYLLEMRERAVAAGDVNLLRQWSGELERIGYTGRGEPMETTDGPREMEHATPAKPRGGRPKLPRCEHDRIVGRCIECDEEQT